MVLKPRQVGFTTLAQARDLWHFLKVPGARVVATCQSMTDHVPAKLLAQNYRTMFEGLERAGVTLDVKETAGEWSLPSRDATLRIIEAGASRAAASKKGRAGTVTRLHLTETAFYEYAEETLNALLECVAGPELGTEIVSESTPNGAAGVFYGQCKEAGLGKSGYRLHFFPWFQQAEYAAALDAGESIEPEAVRERELVAKYGITPQQLKWYRRKVAEKGQALTDQEYPSDPETCFLASGRLFFDREATVRLLAATKPPVFVRADGRFKVWTKPRPGHRYLLAVDTAEGIVKGNVREDPDASKGDYSTCVVYELGSGRHVATLRAHLPPWELAREVTQLARHYNGARICVERNNHGHAVLQALVREQHYPNLYVGADGKLGWLTTSASRPMALDLLEDAHRRGHFRTDDRDLLGEMLTFIVTPNGRAEAERGKYDDLVMAAAMGWAVLTRPAAFRSFAALPVA